MTPAELLADAIRPAHKMLVPLGVPISEQASVLSLAIAGQESNWTHRVQVGGPARSFWQFEKGGGVVGVLTHPSSRDKIKAVCAELGIPCEAEVVYQKMADNDVLGAAMARLLLFTDPQPLPPVGSVVGAWDYYLRNWRPGLPHPEFWAGRYTIAANTVQGKTQS